MIYFANQGNLPWDSEDFTYDEHVQIKEDMDVDELLKGNKDARGVAQFYKLVNKLKFDEQPNYAKLKRLFSS